MPNFAEIINNNNLIFNYGFVPPDLAIFAPPPFSFMVEQLNFDPNDFNSDPIFATSNPNYTGDGSGGSVGGGGAGGGGGGGGAGAASYSVLAPNTGSPSAVGGWSLVQAFFAHNQLWALGFNNNASNTATRPYSKTLGLYKFNSVTSAFEYQTFPAIHDYRAASNLSALKTSAGVSIKEVNSEIWVSYYALDYPFNMNTNNGRTIVILRFQSSGNVILDSITEAEVVTQTSITSLAASNTKPMLFRDMGGLPYFALSGSVALTNVIGQDATTGLGSQFIIGKNFTSTTVNSGNFLDVLSSGVGANGHFPFTMTSAFINQGGSNFTQNFFLGEDDTSPFEVFFVKTSDAEIVKATGSSSAVNYVESNTGSVLHQANGIIRDSNFLNPENRQVLYHSNGDGAFSKIFDLPVDDFGSNDASRKLLSATTRYHNRRGDVLKTTSSRIYFLIRNGSFAIEMTQAIKDATGLTNVTPTTSPVNTPYGFMFMVGGNQLVFVQPTA